MANLKISYAQNPDLKEVFQRWEVGKSYKLEIDFQLMSKDDQGAEGSINEVGVNDGADGKPTEIEPDSNEPVMIVLMAQKHGKSKKSDGKPGKEGSLMMGEPMMARKDSGY